jgi:hypothetical protein
MSSAISFRRLLVGSLIVATFAIIIVAWVLLWPAWQRHRAVLALTDAISHNDDEAIANCINVVDSVEAWDLVVSALSEMLHHPDPEVRKKAIGYVAWWSLDVPRARSTMIEALKTGDEAVVEAVVQSVNAYLLMSSRPLPTWDELAKKSPQAPHMWHLKLICRYHWFATYEFPRLVKSLAKDDKVPEQLAGTQLSDNVSTIVVSHLQEDGPDGWDAGELVDLLELASRDSDPRVQRFATHALKRLASARTIER